MSAQQFRKKPVVIEAVQFTGGETNGADILRWMSSPNPDRTMKRMVAGVNLDGTEAMVVRSSGPSWWAHQDEVRVSNGERCQMLDREHLTIPTLEGTMRGDLNDWIIKGVQGEFYPCKPDIFVATYEAVES